MRSSLSCDSSAGTEITSWIDIETEEPIKYQGKCRYINSSIFEYSQTILVKEVPLGIDGTVICEVPLKLGNNILNLDNCKGTRP